MASATATFTAPDGATLAYRDEGQGKAVLCLAGLTRSMADFDPLVPHLPPCRLIRMDYRGRGASDWTGAATYTVPVEARDALALMDHLEVERAAIIGTSRGGLIGMLLAATAWPRLLGLCLNDIGPVIEPAGLEAISAHVGRDPGLPDWASFAARLARNPGFSDVPEGRWLDEARRRTTETPHGLRNRYDPALGDAFRAAFTGPPPDAWPLFDACAGLPLALIRGMNSDLLSAATAAEMARRRPDMIVADVPGRAHVPFLDEPESLTAIRAFLSLCEGAMTDIAMIEAAAARLKGHARVTPLLSSPFLDQIAGRRVLVKAECLQHTGSFKFRGGWSAVSALAPETRARGVIAFSSGNHAQGVALAARLHGIPAVIVMPADAPATKIDTTRALGAEVVLYDRATEDRDAIGSTIAAARGLTLIRPYDDPQVIAGQGTTGLEIAAQAAAEGVVQADVLVCCGGGGLTAGIALALAARAPGLRARPAEPRGFDDTARSLATGRILRNPQASGTLCDAIVTPEPGQITFPILLSHCGPGLVVSDDQALEAMALAFSRLRIVLEPGGAVALAAALFHPDQVQGDAVIAVATGGNVDPAVFAGAIARA